MKVIHYQAETNKAMLQLMTKLGKANLKISVSDDKLNWNEINLDIKQTKELLNFLNNNVMG